MAQFEGVRGVTYDQPAGAYRLRWRQNERQADGAVLRVPRAFTVQTFSEAARLAHEIRAALDTKGYWEEPTAPSKPNEINLERAALKWLQWKTGVRGVRGSTPGNLSRCLQRFFRALRHVLDRRPEETVWASDLTVTAVGQACEAMRQGFPPLQPKGYSEGTVYQTIAACLDMWKWLASVEEFAAVPAPPYSDALVLPPPPVYVAPSDDATAAECDAVIRNIRSPRARHLAIVMRYTGLRISQAAAIHREDLSASDLTLLIRKGKSRREAATRRRVPISPHLLRDLGPLLAAVPHGPLFPDRDKTDEQGIPLPMANPRNLTSYITEAWAFTVQQGRCRPEVWQPPNRLKNRPDHAFRATFQSILQAEGFGDNVIDWLVGHAPRNTRGKHYTLPHTDTLRRAVQAIPPIDWQEEGCVVAFP